MEVQIPSFASNKIELLNSFGISVGVSWVNADLCYVKQELNMSCRSCSSISQDLFLVEWCNLICQAFSILTPCLSK